MSRGRHIVTVELLAQAFLNSVQAVTSVWVGLTVFQAVVDDLVVPVRNWNRLGVAGDPVPQRLQVVNLFVDREVVEAGWWKELTPPGSTAAVPPVAGPRNRLHLVQEVVGFRRPLVSFSVSEKATADAP